MYQTGIFESLLEYIRMGLLYTADHEIEELIRVHKLSGYINSDVPEGIPGGIRSSEVAVQRKLDEYCQQNNLPNALIKGRALNDYLYDSIKHTYNDIDILVKAEDACKLHTFLSLEGYVQYSGISSIPMIDNTSDRARFINSLIRSQKRFGDGSVPLKSHADMPEYAPYSCEGKMSVEVHDGIFFLPKNVTDEMLGRTAMVGTEQEYNTLDLADTFIVLLMTAYENSESLNSNLYDHGMVLRDYVDIRNFLHKFDDKEFWQDVEDRIRAYGVEQETAIIMFNLALVYDRDVSNGHLSGIKAKPGLYDKNILERMNSKEVAVQSARRLFSKKMTMKAEQNAYVICKKNSAEAKWFGNKNHGAVCSITESGNMLHITVRINKKLWESKDEYMYQCRFYPGNNTEYVMYKLDLAWFEDEIRSYGHRTATIRKDAIKRKTNHQYDVRFTEFPEFTNAEITLKKNEIIFRNTGRYYVSFNTYRHQAEDIYFQTDERKIYTIVINEENQY